MIIFYSLIVSAVLLIMWAAYRLCGVGRGRDFNLSRMLLVGSVLFVLAMAAVPFLMPAPQQPVLSVDVEAGPVAAVAFDGEPAEPTVSLTEIIVAVYWIGFAVFALRLLLNLSRIVLIIMRSKKHGAQLRLHDDNRLVPFTWGKWIVMSEEDYRRSGSELMLHEGAHLRACHWLDLLLINSVQCLTWYAPGAPLLRRELSKVHEFVADRAVIEAGFDNESYMMLLINKASGRRFANSVTAGINKSIIKQRIAMMQKSLSAGSARKRALALVPAAILAAVFATNPAVASEASALTPKTAPATDVVVSTKRVTEVYIEGVGTLSGPNVGKELVIVDGVERKFSELQSIAAEGKILSASVVKASDAIAKYGQKAKYGVIELITEDAPEEMKPKARAVDAPSVVVERRNANAIVDNPEVVAAESSEPSESSVQKDEEKVFTTAEKAPQFKGGDVNMYKFITQNMKYPEQAVKDNIQGRVVVQFVVKTDGTIGDVKVIRGVHELLDAEAVRVVKTMTDWIPGTLDGKPVNVWYAMPLTFKLAADETK